MTDWKAVGQAARISAIRSLSPSNQHCPYNPLSFNPITHTKANKLTPNTLGSPTPFPWPQRPYWWARARSSPPPRGGPPLRPTTPHRGAHYRRDRREGRDGQCCRLGADFDRAGAGRGEHGGAPGGEERDRQSQGGASESGERAKASERGGLRRGGGRRGGGVRPWWGGERARTAR